MAMDEDVLACARIVERGDPARFAAVMAAPVPVRSRLFPIYAFNVEVARAPWVTQEPMIAEMRLQWWRDVLEEIRAGGPVRRHEVAVPLAHVLSPAGAGRLDALIDARRWDIAREPFEDHEDLCGYLRATSGGLLLTAAAALGGAPEEPVLQAGFAQGVANWFLAVPELERAGRKPLVDGRPEGVRALAMEGQAALRAARRTTLPKPAHPAMLALWQTDAILAQAAADPTRVADGTLLPPPFRSRLSLSLRALTGRW
ncbi:squalene/phytoene synthase family protein [Roseovarius aestuariivivens]|uniref:squalene/phytoene synthase family protein n=1 Tax=Roseovarius aestuariivivens TaxID=1888910 RepID=UPI001081C2F9|nr:squalene/phytoene synthase family protein [Roseovarius aestuariivivens]